MSDDVTAYVESILAPAETPKDTPKETESEDTGQGTESENEVDSVVENTATTTKSEDDDDVEAVTDEAEDDEEEEEEVGEESDEQDDDDEEDDEDQDTEEEEEDDEPDDVVYTTAEGDEVTLEELKRGHLRQADYTRKTQELAEQRNEVAAEREGIQQHNVALAQHLNLALNVIEPELAQYANVNWQQLAAEDPYEYAEHQAKFQQAQARYAQIQEAAAASLQQHKAQQSAAYEAKKAEEAKALMLAIPDLADPKKGRALSEKIKEYGRSTVGLSDEEAGNLMDHRLVLVMNKARLYDEMVESAGTVRKKKRTVKGPKRTVRAGTPMSKGEKQAKSRKAADQRLKKTGSADAAVDWLLTS